MKINYTPEEAQRIINIAKEYDVNPQAVMETHEAMMNANFEQDLIDLLNDDADAIRKDYGEYGIDKTH